MISRRPVTLAVIVAALGYFVDIYDLILYGTVRDASLRELGIANVTGEGVFLFAMQMGGIVVGGLLWGILGDRRGRLSVLFGSIVTYSLANLANAFVDNVEQYAVCRAVAGIGLAGELGAGITLVSELMDKKSRGIGTAIVAGVGLAGGIFAGIVGGGLPWLYEGAYWRTAYIIGGSMGFALLLLRIGVTESGMFEQAQKSGVSRGNFLLLFTSRARLVRYLAVIAIGVPIWYAIGILITFCNAIGSELGISPPPRPATALMLSYAGLAVGDIGAGLISQWMKSRRRALALFIIGTGASVVLYFTVGAASETAFYACCVLIGVTTGYWAVFVTTAAENFGTNLRATVATTTPNFVRGTGALLAMAFGALVPTLGSVVAAAVLGVVAIAIGLLGLLRVRETFGVDLDYLEQD